MQSAFGVLRNGQQIEQSVELHDCDFFSVDEYQFYFKEGKIYFDQTGLRINKIPVHEIRHCVNELEYPLFNRNTRIIKQLPDDKI